MKTKEEIEKLAYDAAIKEYKDDGALGTGWDDYKYGFSDCYTQYQILLKEEIRKAFIHGQGNAQMMEAGLERDEVDDYVNSRLAQI